MHQNNSTAKTRLVSNVPLMMRFGEQCDIAHDSARYLGCAVVPYPSQKSPLMSMYKPSINFERKTNSYLKLELSTHVYLSLPSYYPLGCLGFLQNALKL